jgi:hypothetical protein
MNTMHIYKATNLINVLQVLEKPYYLEKSGKCVLSEASEVIIIKAKMCENQ